MKNGIITGAIVLAGLGGFALLNNSDNSSKSNFPVRNDDPKTERSFAEYGDKDCADFSSQGEAQEFFEDQGGPDEDFHNLDRDGDGIVCESLKKKTDE